MGHDQIKHRLVAQEAELEELRKVAGIASVSVGVIHEGELLYTHHYGFQDVEAKRKADGDTLYGVGSCSKSFFAAVATAVAEEKGLNLEEPVKTYLPEFRSASPHVTESATLIDLLAHRTGLTGVFHLCFQHGRHIIGNDNFWTYFQKLQPVTSLRGKWLYNSFGYSVVGKVIERATGASLNECLSKYICKPLGLTRTTTELDFDNTPNFAKAYSTLEDGTPFPLKERQDFRNHFFEPAAGIYTTLNDTVKYVSAILSESTRFTPDEKAVEANNGVLKNPAALFSQHIPVLNPSFLDRSYALGWIRTQLPGTAGVMGDNIRLFGLSELPIIGRGMDSRLLFYHQGATVGYFPSFYLFPESKSACVVLTNTISLGDQADWIAQALSQTLFDDKPKIDWIALSKRTRDELLDKYHQMQEEVMAKKSNKPPPRDLAEYCGDYYDDTGIFFFRVIRAPNSKNLLLSFQGLESHVYELRYWYGDVFEWVLTRDETAKRARYHQFNQRYFSIYFSTNDSGGEIDRLSWWHDPNFPDAESFMKRK